MESDCKMSKDYLSKIDPKSESCTEPYYSYILYFSFPDHLPTFDLRGRRRGGGVAKVLLSETRNLSKSGTSSPLALLASLSKEDAKLSQSIDNQ